MRELLLVSQNQIKITIVFLIIFMMAASAFTTPHTLSQTKNQYVLNPTALITVPVVVDPIQIDPVSIPVKTGTDLNPTISSDSAYVIDTKSFTPLFEKNPHRQYYPASTTKITTALVTLSELNLDETVTVPNDLFYHVSGSMMGLTGGLKLTRKELLWGMLLNSGNDAAYTLAATSPFGENTFIEKMNDYAKQLHLNETNFSNVIGFDTLYHQSSAFDLAILTRKALENNLFQEVVATPQKTINITEPIKRTIQLKNTNELLGEVPGVLGVKTGWTELAEGVLVTRVSRNGHEIIAVVMHSPNRESDMKNIVEWVYRNYTW